jgi:Alternate to MurJ
VIQQVLILCLFTAIIHATDTASYAIRLAGIRVGKLAVALSLAGIVVLVSRTSNLVQGFFSGAMVDDAINGKIADIAAPFRVILFSASIGTLITLLLFPTLVFISARIISHLEVAGSLPEMIKHSVTIERLKHAGKHIKRPRIAMLARLRIGGLPKRLLLLNCLVTAVYTVGVLAALYAAVLTPDNFGKAIMSSGLINGIATIIFAMFVDPQVAIATDRALTGRADIETLNKMFGLLMISRFVGTILAQLLLVPAAYWIKWIVEMAN